MGGLGRQGLVFDPGIYGMTAERKGISELCGGGTDETKQKNFFGDRRWGRNYVLDLSRQDWC